MQRIAIFGGSFNPVHNAHIELAEQFIKSENLDKVILVPTGITPLKDNKDIIDTRHRMNMCRLAIKHHEKIELSDIETSRHGISYTSDTISLLKKQFDNDTDFYLIVGADMFSTLTKWHDFKYIFTSATILVAPRNDIDYISLSAIYQSYKKYNCKAVISCDYIGDLSSTMIRDMIKNGSDLSNYLNKDVIDYINDNNLYR